MITFKIDELTPCLTDVSTGDIVDTEVVQIKRKSFLKKFNKRTGWHVNWATLADTNDIYALVLEGTVSVQGLIALQVDEDLKAVFISWACVNPESNKLISEPIKYSGIGGHLFAIAGDISKKAGYEGFVTGFAANQKLAQHYEEVFGADIISALHPYQIMIKPFDMEERILKVYNYEWTEEKL